ncbi:lysophospholipid acyltransferase family protein [Hahella sp. KA22]|uniref:lysophospholipid acyltransferase family protein n=1 Tax=Hahella sp. KA22 TaxID=1628392 RepID=UPI00351A27BD
MISFAGIEKRRAKVQAFQLFRSFVFYIGYAWGVIITSLIGMLVGPYVNFEKRYYIVSRFNVFALWWARIVCGIRYEIEGLENIPKTSCVVVSNHQSAWETYLLGVIFRPQCTVLKQELMKVPFFGWALKRLKPIAIDRSKPSAALKQLLKQGKERLTSGYWVVIYPEGTRVRPGQVGKYNKGGALLAVSAGVPLLPVAHNAGDCWPAGSISKRPGLIRVKVGAPIETSGRATDEVHKEMEEWIRRNSAALSQA